VMKQFPEAELLVVPYPMLVDEDVSRECDLGLSKSERQFVVDFIDKLDGVILNAATAAGATYVHEAKEAFAGAKLCDDPAAANHLRIVPPAGDEIGRYSPANWIPGSMHPNEMGHERLAAAVACYVAPELNRPIPEGCPAPEVPEITDSVEDPPADTVTAELVIDPTCEELVVEAGEEAAAEAETDTSLPPEPVATVPPVEAEAAEQEEAVAEQEEAAETCAAVEDAVNELSDQVAAFTDELLSDDEWIQDELFRTIRALAFWLALLVAAGVVLAAGVVRLDNEFSNFLSGRESSKGE